MSAETYKKRAILMTVACVVSAFICVACTFFLGCGNEGGNEEEPPRDGLFIVVYSSDEGGNISGTKRQFVNYGEPTAVVTAVPSYGYEFEIWSDGVKTVDRNEKRVTNDMNVTAIFKKKIFTVEYVAGKSGSIVGETRQSTEYLGTLTTVIAVPDVGYRFVGWSDGVTEITRTDSGVSWSGTVEAKFERIIINLNYAAEQGGYIEGKTKQEIDYGQSGSAVTAESNEGYEFIGWSDGITEATRTETNVQTDIAVTAVFKKKVFSVIYGYSYPIYGTIEGNRIQQVEFGGTSETVKAVPIEGYEFEKWSDGCTDAERTDYNVTSDIRVTACYKVLTYSVVFRSSDGMIGSVYGTSYATVRHGEQSPTVEARAKDGYVFIKWSDGLETPRRTEYNVKSDMEFIAYFGVSATYTVNGVGGTIKGETYQEAIIGEDFAEVDAVPDEGYAFGGWSDLQVTSIRQDKSAARQIEHIAYFEPILKTFKYDFGLLNGAPLNSSVTINRNDIQITGYITPTMQGYTFAGWYADKEYKLKVINEEGRYMLGYYGFSLETDALYARWKPNDDEGPIFKILMVYINEVKATLYPAKKGGDEIARDVHHLMTTIDREYCVLSHSLMLKYLGKWLAGVTTIEVDAYFTIQPLDNQYIHYVEGQSEDYDIKTSEIPELSAIYQSYNSILNVFSLNNYNNDLANINIAGSAFTKYADIHMEDFYRCILKSNISIQYNLIRLKTNKSMEEEFIDTFIHEFIHTCESIYADGEILQLHEAFRYYNNATEGERLFDNYRLYLLGEFMYEGKQQGIPKKFWMDKADKLLSLNWYKASLANNERNN